MKREWKECLIGILMTDIPMYEKIKSQSTYSDCRTKSLDKLNVAY